MIREIKFRIWNQKQKKMYPPFSFFAFRNWIPKQRDFFTVDGAEQKVRIMQFTGLYDNKTGKEIYEGDIVKKFNSSFHPRRPNKECGIFEVCWNEKSAGFCMTGDRSHIYEVIGNIYENPELLEKYE